MRTPVVDAVGAPNIVANDGILASNDRNDIGWEPILFVIVAGTGLVDALDLGVKTGVPPDEESSEGV